MRCCINEKILQLAEFFERNKVDVVFITKLNTKWTTKSHDMIINRLKGLGRSLEIIVANSKAHYTIDSD